MTSGTGRSVTLVRRAELVFPVTSVPRVVDVRLAGGRIKEIGVALPARRDEVVIDAAGRALLPGLHDHHLHLFALAANRASVAVGPPDVEDEEQLRLALRSAAERLDGRGWVRAVGYHESVAGTLDADRLDALLPDYPVRVQHRTGVCWMLSSAALAQLPLEDAPPGGVERDAAGHPTGRLFRMDGWLRSYVPKVPIDLAAVGRDAASWGVTGLTDADPDRGEEATERLAAAHRSGDLPQRLMVMGPRGMVTPTGAEIGPVKVMLDDDRLPPFDSLVDVIVGAHNDGRAIAAHCVTRAQLIVFLAALDEAGSVTGDRIEHGSVIPPGTIERLAELRTTVVTQPNLVAERGEQYRQDVEQEELPNLWRARSLIDAGVPLAGGTDAPHGRPDPWRAIRSAIHRVDGTGTALGPGERLTAHHAVGLFLGPADDPGRPREVRVGERADLCLLPTSFEEAVESMTSDGPGTVAATLIGGTQVWP